MKTRSRGSADTEDGPGAPAIIGNVVDGRYKILDLIGTGGMGRVYRAEQAYRLR